MSSSNTSFERVMAAVDLSKADRVPVIPQITYATSQILNLKFSDPMFDAKLMAKSLWAGYDLMRYDGIYAGWESSFNLVAEAMGCRLRIFEDQNPSVIEVSVRRPEDLKRLKTLDPEKDGRLPIYLKAIDILRSKVKKKVPLLSYVPGPLTLSGVLYGLDRLMLAIIENPEFVLDLNRVTTSASQEFATAKAVHGADIVVVADPTASIDLISPDMFKEFSLPYLKEVIHSICDAGAVPSLHICGQTGPILQMMVQTGAKILEVDRKVDLRDAKKRVGSKVCLMGNVDTAVFFRGKPSDVEAEARACIEAAAGDAGFILSSGCEVPLNSSVENIKTMVEAAKKYGRY